MLPFYFKRKQGKAPNVYLRSALRQPVRTGMLLCLIGAVCFAFTSHAAQALYIWRETKRVEDGYHAVGYLQALEDPTADASEAADALEQSAFVQLVDRRRQASGVLQGEYNVDWSSRGTNDCEHGDVFVCGTFQGMRPAGWGGQELYFAVDTVLAGYPEYVEAGDVITLATSRTDSTLAAGAADALEQLVRGERYLVRGRYDQNDPSCKVATNMGMGSRDFSVSAFVLVPLDGAELWSCPLAKGEPVDLSRPEMQDTARELEHIDSNQRAMVLAAMQDVSLNAVTQEGASAYYLEEGRWPDGADDAAGARVCAVHKGFASARGLEVGDVITMSLRDVPAGYLYGDAAQDPEAQRRTDAAAYEIVGIYNDYTASQSAYAWNVVFVPDSALPASFGTAQTALQGGACSFVLTSPAQEQAFRDEMDGTLAEQGFQAVLLETNWDNFYSTESALRSSALRNVLLYTAALLGTLGLAVFLYLYFRKKDTAIARAMGLPQRQCARQLAVPLLLVGMAGAAIGCAAGWRQAQSQAAETLQVLEEFGGDTAMQALSPLWLAVLCGGVWCVLGAAALGAAAYASGRPVLVLLHGSQSKRGGQSRNAPHPAPQAAAARGPMGKSLFWSFVWRQIFRARLRSTLTALLAAVFLVSLSGIRLSILANQSRLGRLSETTVVTLELVQANTNAPPYGLGGGIIRQATVDALLDTGFIEKSVLEGAAMASVLPYDEPWTEGRQVSVQGELTSAVLCSFDDAEAFFAETGRNVSITYADGWDESLFAADWSAETGDTLFPLVLPRTLLEELGVAEGGTLGVVCKGSFRLCRIAGVYDGSVAGAGRFGSAILLPNSALRKMTGEDMLYSRAGFTIAPARNVELDAFRASLDALLREQPSGIFQLAAVLEDSELRQAVEPVRANIAFMEKLYPAILALSLLCGAGASALLLLLSSREAAILRVLGTTRRRSLGMLCSVCLLPCLVGIAAGLLLGLLAQPGQWATLLCAALYGAASAAGAVLSGAAVLRRDPLELLQSRE